MNMYAFFIGYGELVVLADSLEQAQEKATNALEHVEWPDGTKLGDSPEDLEQARKYLNVGFSEPLISDAENALFCRIA